MKSKSGFTILEIMISIAVMTIVAASIFPIVVWLISRGHNFADENRAAWLLQEGQEVSYNVFLKDFDKDGMFYPVGIYHPAVSVVGGNQKWVLLTGEQTGLETRFTRKIEISKVCRNKDTGERLDFPCNSPDVIDNNSRIIKTTISWYEAGAPKNINASLLLTEISP